jgi:pimeloyl-ACP methyl ester carboxylesterase
VIVVHGFNTHGYASVIRWAAMLYANGYDVLAADQRDFSFEHDAGFGYPAWQQTFGWKESEDVLAAGRYLAAQRGTKDIGVVGFSEGGQNTVCRARARSPSTAGECSRQASSSAAPPTRTRRSIRPQCRSAARHRSARIPVTDALVQLVVPPYDNANVCVALTRAGTRYGTDGFGILAHETAYHAQQRVKVPLLNVYSADDSLVPAFEAR